VPKTFDAAGGLVATWWDRLKDKPGGRALFSMLIGRMAPYTNTIGARVQELGPGHSRWVMRDRRKVRNHLNSTHAVALVNLAEVASGTAMLMGLSPKVRGIVTGLRIEYRKKARGTLTATCDCTVPSVATELSFDVPAVITDAAGDVVAEALVTWKLAPLSS
jgi:acyl-coenzyme A thioesterase PaaI-like protein